MPNHISITYIPHSLLELLKNSLSFGSRVVRFVFLRADETCVGRNDATSNRTHWKHVKVACLGSMDLASGQSRGLLHFLPSKLSPRGVVRAFTSMAQDPSIRSRLHVPPSSSHTCLLAFLNARQSVFFWIMCTFMLFDFLRTCEFSSKF